MTRVAIAGATGSIGGVIAAAIASTKKHEVFVLSRKAPDASNNSGSISTLTVNYDSVDDIETKLTSNNIDTVICCMSLNSEAENASQINIIRAAAKSPTVKRFAPSEFGIDYMEASRQKYPFPSTEFKVAAIQELQKTDLQYTRFITSTFMDYFGPQNAPSQLKVLPLFIDHQSRKATIPGDGNTPVVLTHSTDVGKFVAAAVDLPEWQEKSLVIGDKLTLNELVERAEAVGKCKYEVTHVSIDKFQSGDIPELPCDVHVYRFVPKEMVMGIRQGAGLAMAAGWMNLDTSSGTLNDRLPGVESLSVAKFFSKYVAEADQTAYYG
ncbi:hypothetical protein VFPPC_02148 [Pochonia chlamydosporia 170]|uniref:NmrA-like domain-containing protein n=1 Tax=Pochonia chlamydosporia 170 TaxID=1380566 RepID=A0A179F6S0_METCM|nr:hypothetical protein VFPPC_02148 [Pochonia chlamydosporia 170]OAQ61138.1 hypothetical protein VFPPC_02148 [Pochonia chlamydosporia 170]